MGKLVFFSDLHCEGEGSREKGLEEIVSFSNTIKADQLVFGGDAIGDSQVMIANALVEQKIAPSFAKSYAKISEMTYMTMDKILSQFNGDVHGIQGNHDPVGIFEKMKSVNFKPSADFGKVYMENMPISGWFEGGDAITIPENKEYRDHAIKNKPAIMLWHQGPYDVDYGHGSTFICPPELKDVGTAAKINLHGHNHQSFIKYDADTKTLNVNMITKDGYFAVIEYDDKKNPLHYEVYQNMTIKNNEPDPQAIAQETLHSIAERSQHYEKQPQSPEEKAA